MQKIRGFFKKCLVILASLILLIGALPFNKAVFAEEDKPIVYTSFYPIYKITEDIVGDTVDLRMFQPVNSDPHTWEPTPKKIAELNEADLLIINGANLEPWREQIEEALPDLNILSLADGINLITYTGAAALGDFQYMGSYDYEVGEYPIDFGHTHSSDFRISFYNNKDNLPEDELVEVGKKIMEEEGTDIGQWESIPVESGQVYRVEMGHEYGGVSYTIPEEGNWVFFVDRKPTDQQPYQLLDKNEEPLNFELIRDVSTTGEDKITFDPHTWLSIRNAKRFVNDIEAELRELYPENRRRYRLNASKLSQRMTSLDYEYRDKFKDLEFREFAVTHYAFEYLAQDFDLKQFPLQGLTSTEPASLRKIKEAIEWAKRNDVKTIFYEYGVPDTGAGTIAEEVGGEAEPLISMEYISVDMRAKDLDYVDMMEYNLEKIYQSLIKAQEKRGEN